MFCSRSIGIHLLRGLSAFVLIGWAMYLSLQQSSYWWLAPFALVAAFVLLRGCPMCWMIGLFETIANRRASRLQAK